MTNDLRILKKELKSFAKRVKDFKYTDSALITFLLTGLIMLSGISLNLYSDEIKTQQEAINMSIFQLQKDFKRARQENNKLLRNTNLELIQLMEQGDHVVKSPWGSFQFGSNYVYNDWKGTYKGRGDKKEAIKYARENDKFGTYAGAKQGTTELKRVIEPISAVPVDAAVRPKTVTIDAIAGASAPVIKTPTLNVNVSSVTPSTASVPSITPPKVNIPTVSMKNVEGFTLVFPNSQDFSTRHNTDSDYDVNINTSTRVLAGSSPNYISYHEFAGNAAGVTRLGGGSPTTSLAMTLDTTITMSGSAEANNTYGSNQFYGGGSRFAYIDDVRNHYDGLTFTLKNQANIKLVGPAIVGILNEETSYTDGNLTTNITNVGSISDESENLSQGTKYSGTLRNNVNATSPYAKDVYVNNKGKTGYKVGLAQTTEETVNYTRKTFYEFFNGDTTGTPSSFNDFDSKLNAAVSSPTFSSIYTALKDTNINGNIFNPKGVIHFSGDYSTGIQVAAEHRPNGTPGTTNDRSLVRANNKENGYIQLDGSHSYGMKLSGQAIKVDNNDYNPNSIVASYMANNGLILISGSYDTGIHTGVTNDHSDASHNYGSSAGMAKLKEAKWSSQHTIFNNGKIYVGGYNNSGILLESIYDDTVTNNGNITIDKAYNLFNNPDNSVNFSNAVAESNAGIRVQSYSTTDTAAGTDIVGINKGTININNGSGNVGIYAFDVRSGSIPSSTGHYIVGDNTNVISINDGSNVGMMAQDDSGSATNFKTIIRNSGTINVGGKGSIGMYTNDEASFAEQNSGTITASSNNIGVVNKGTFDFKGGTIKATGVNSVGVYSKNGTNSTTTIGTGTPNSATLNVSDGGVGLYADDGSTQTLKGLNADVSGTDKAGSILFYNIKSQSATSGGKFDVTNANAGNATIGKYSFAFYTNDNLFSGGTTFAQFLNDWIGASGPGVKLTMKPGSSLLLDDVSDAGNKNVLFSNITPITGPTLQNKSSKIVATLTGDYQYLTVKGADVKIDETNYDLSDVNNKLNKVSIYDSNITVNNGTTVHDGASPNVAASTNLVSQGYILGVNNGRTLTNKGTITMNSTTPALKTLVAIGTDDKTHTVASKAVNDGTITSKINDGIGIYVGDGAEGTNNSGKSITMDGIKAFGIVGSEANTENKGDITINGVSSIGMYSVEDPLAVLDKKAKNSGNITTTEDNNIAMVGDNSDILNDTTGKINLNNSNNNVGMYTSAKGTITNNGTIKGIDKTIGIYGKDKIELGSSSSITVGDSGVALYSSTGDVKVNPGAKIELIKGGSGSTPADNATGVFVDNSRGTASTVNIDVHDLVQSNLGKNSYGYFFKDVNTLNYTNSNGSNPITLDDGSIFIYSDATNGNVHNAQDLTSVGNGVIGLYQTGGTITNAGKLEFNTGTKNTAVYTVNGAATNQAAGSIEVGASNFGMVTTGGFLTNDGKINITANKGTGMYSSSLNAITNNGIVTTATGVTDAVGIYGKTVNNTSSGKITVGDANVGIYSNDGDITNDGTISVGNNKAIGIYTVGSNQNINTNAGSTLSIGDDSFGFVDAGKGNTITSYANPVTLGSDAIYAYQNDNTGKIVNYTPLTSSGDRNYGLYGNGTTENYGTIDFSNGNGNVGIYSTNGGVATNFGTIKVGPSNTSAKEYGVGMATGYYDEATNKTSNEGTIINRGTIEVSKANTMGMYAVGPGSKAINYGTINLSGRDTIGMYLDRGAHGENWGTIQTTVSGLRGVKGIYLSNGSYIKNYGTINIAASDIKSAGIWADTQSFPNAEENSSGRNPITGASQTGTSTPLIKVVTADDMKEMGGVTIKVPPRMTPVTVTDAQGNVIPIVKVDTDTPAPNPVSVTVTSPSGITTLNLAVNNMQNFPSASEATSIGMYVDTSGVNYTNPIQGLNNLVGLEDISLYFGPEASRYTTSKAIEIGDNILKPYNDALRGLVTAGTTLYVTSPSLTWMAQPTKDPSTGLLDKVYLVKVPYTAFAKDGDDQTYNFLAGLEKRYGVEGLGTQEKLIFDKISSLTGGEGHILAQAIDEMKGHQYSNIQQRTKETGDILNNEFSYLQNEWENPTKDSSKIKAFGQRGEYKTDTAGVVDYASNAYGVAYVHEKEGVTLGNKTGWYAGAVTNHFKFKDLGRSREDQTMMKAGIFKTVSPVKDHNGSLQWTISGEAFAGANHMKRRYWVVDDTFEAKSDYATYGVALRNELGKDIRTSERTSIRPYGALNLEYGRYTGIKEDGPMALEVRGNDYISVQPEAGVSFNYRQPVGLKSSLKASLAAAYTNELGEVNDVKNKAKLRGADAPHYELRGDKENRKGSGKFDLNLGFENTRFGVTVNAGYDTKGENVRGGIGFRAIY